MNRPFPPKHVALTPRTHAALPLVLVALGALASWACSSPDDASPDPGLAEIAASSGETIFGGATPAHPSDPDGAAVELGLKFRSDVAGSVTGLRFYKGAGNTGSHTGHLWSGAGASLASVTFTNESASGWQTASFSKPVPIKAGTTYVVSYHAPKGHYAGDNGYFTNKGAGTAPLHGLASGVDGKNGVYRYGATSGFPTESWEDSNYYVDVVFQPSGSGAGGAAGAAGAAGKAGGGGGAGKAGSGGAAGKSGSGGTAGKAGGAGAGGANGACTGAPNTPGGPDPWGGCFPGANNTGVPAGITLTPYTGSCDIRDDNVVIDAKTIDCGGMLVYGKNLTIKNSRSFGPINTNSDTASVTIQDSEIDGGADVSQAVGLNDVTVLRSNIHGDQHAVHCNGDCVVQDSWLHDLHDGGPTDHQNGFLSNGGDRYTLSHNSVSCNGGCTADVAFLNDDNQSNANVSKNLLVASPDASYCAYPAGGTTSKPGVATNMVWTDNVFQRGANKKCGYYGAVYAWDSTGGNVWSGNTWDDGTTLTP